MSLVERVASKLGTGHTRKSVDTAPDVEDAATPRPGYVERAHPMHEPAHVPGADRLPRIPESDHNVFTVADEFRRASTGRSVNAAPPPFVLDLALLATRHFITPGSERTQVGEGFRRIKRHVLANALKTRDNATINHVMVTSALAGEGKTFCAINLAISMALELERSVLLVDADTVKPNVLPALGLDRADRGLIDLLTDRSADPAQFIHATNIKNLSILPSGPPHPEATELLGSQTMAKLIEDLAGPWENRIVVFDSPPLLLTSEAAALASHVSQVLMIVEAGRVTHSTIKDALRRLEACNTPVATVLNKKLNPKTYFSYGNGYGYGSGYGD